MPFKQLENNLRDLNRHYQLVADLYNLWVFNTNSVYIPKLIDYIIENKIIQIHFDGNASGERQFELLYKIFTGEIESESLDTKDY